MCVLYVCVCESKDVLCIRACVEVTMRTCVDCRTQVKSTAEKEILPIQRRHPRNAASRGDHKEREKGERRREM